jgi:predicted TIM-barrel fold metal-dependent hydrolase
MDAHGISRALLAPPSIGGRIGPEDGYRWTLEAVQQHPDRFGLSVRADPHEGMNAVRQLESMVKNDGGIALRFVPFQVGKPLDDRIYFPLYTKCVELGIPVTAPVGISGPRVPSMLQHPEHLDDLCYLWPELTIVTTHGGEPWTWLLVKLMTKWPNLYHMISAFAPQYYPKDTINFLNSSRGRMKVMFATDYPLISFERAMAELPNTPISDQSWQYFLHDNAARVFWNEE